MEGRGQPGDEQGRMLLAQQKPDARQEGSNGVLPAHLQAHVGVPDPGSPHLEERVNEGGVRVRAQRNRRGATRRGPHRTQLQGQRNNQIYI